MKARVGKPVEIPRVIVVQMRQNYVGDLLGVQPDQRQRVRRIPQQVTLAPSRPLPARSRVSTRYVQSLRRSTQTK